MTHTIQGTNAVLACACVQGGRGKGAKGASRDNNTKNLSEIYIQSVHANAFSLFLNLLFINRNSIKKKPSFLNISSNGSLELLFPFFLQDVLGSTGS